MKRKSKELLKQKLFYIFMGIFIGILMGIIGSTSFLFFVGFIA